MKKVVIEITSQGWMETIVVGDVEISKRFKKASYGYSALDGDWDDHLMPMQDADILFDALDSQSFDEISDALSEIEEGES